VSRLKLAAEHFKKQTSPLNSSMGVGYKFGKMEKAHIPCSRRKRGAQDPFAAAKERAEDARCQLTKAQQKNLDKRLIRWVSTSTNSDKLIQLLEEGADPNARERSIDLTALMIASKKGKDVFAGILLDYGADEAARGYGNVTAYEVAKVACQWSVVALFRERGFDCVQR